MNSKITLANTKAVLESLEDEPPQLVFEMMMKYETRDVIAAKQLADEAGLDFEDVLLIVLGE